MIEIPNMTYGYKIICDVVRDNGRDVSPRGEATLELPDFIFCLHDPTEGLALGCGRLINRSIAAVEAIQLIGGFGDPELVTRVSRNFEKFMDDNDFWGMYGRRIGGQLVFAAQKLVTDPATRQAVITIFDPNLDNVAGKHDYPCTLSLTFQIRDGKLELHTTMRSNDVWLGLPYDVFQFTQLQITLARALEVGLGPYYPHAISLHLYERDFESIKKLTSPWPDHTASKPMGFGFEGKNNIFGAIMRARLIGTGYADEVKHITASEQWYIDRLGSYLPTKG